MYLTRKN